MNPVPWRTRLRPSRRAWLVLVPVAAVAGLLAATPLLRRQRGLPASPVGLELHARPKELADLQFSDDQGKATSLAAFRGRVVLLNIWATWCAPCREEMPTLDRLQAALGGPDFEVVALSIDEGGMRVVQQFFTDAGIKHLRPYLDTAREAMPTLGVAVVPLTLLIDRAGREAGRKLGPARWDSQEMAALIRGHIAHDRAQTRAPPG